MQNFFPILAWLKTYKKGDFIKDLLAGFTVGIILIPQGMAYAMIAGLPPVYGLYAALLFSCIISYNGVLGLLEGF